MKSEENGILKRKKHELTGELGGLGCVDLPPDRRHLHLQPPSPEYHLSRPNPHSRHCHTRFLQTNQTPISEYSAYSNIQADSKVKFAA